MRSKLFRRSNLHYILTPALGSLLWLALSQHQRNVGLCFLLWLVWTAAYAIVFNLLQFGAKAEKAKKTRQMLDLLDRATAGGAAYDRRHSKAGKDGGPTGYGETLAGIVLKVRSEVHRARGRD